MPSYWSPGALNLPSVPYPMPPFMRPPAPPMRAPSPQKSYSWTMPWSQTPGVMGFPGDAAEYNRKFQQSYSSPEAARDYGNTAAQQMFSEKAKWDRLPGFAKFARKHGYSAAGRPMGQDGYGGGLAGSYQQALDAANQANEARYQDVLGGYQSRYQRGLGMLSGLGQQEAQDINEQYDAVKAKNQQDLIGRGLGNSTVMATMAQGNERERAASLGRLNERMRQQAMQTDAGLSGDVLSFMERKTEAGPDMRMLAQLAQGMGTAGYGSAAGGGWGGGYGGGGPNLGTAWATTGGFPAGAINGGMGFINPMAGMTPRNPQMFPSGQSGFPWWYRAVENFNAGRPVRLPPQSRLG